LQSAAADSLNRGELVRVDAVAGDWLRISAGTGAQGFIARRLTETPSESNLQLTDSHVVVSAPQKDAPVIGEFAAGRELSALGRFGDFTLVKMPGGFYGWARPELARPGLARPELAQSGSTRPELARHELTRATSPANSR